MILTTKHFKKIAPNAREWVVCGIIANQDIMVAHDITNHRRHMFLAQIAHESDGFRTTREYATGEAYEFRKDLGNIEKGDGVKYRGRGLIQLTGRENYAKFGKLLRTDLINFPEKLEKFPLALTSACIFWMDRGLNSFADKGDFEEITRRINGGLNGYESRLEYLDRVVEILNEEKSYPQTC